MDISIFTRTRALCGRLMRADDRDRAARMLSILHISDLHRSAEDPVSNDELIATLTEDIDRVRSKRPWSEPLSAIVVSGDLVQGCTLGVPNYSDELRAQYQCARDFLARLADELLSGDLSRLVVVPGNHDVCWNTARASMEEYHPSPQERPHKLLMTPGSPFRWDWSSLQLLRIKDFAQYAERWTPYRQFVDDLYGDSPPEYLSDDIVLHEVDGIAIVGFNSCQFVDCCNHSASIAGEAIARTVLALKRREHLARIAVWHHNLEGPPQATDYMGHEVARRLAYHGFALSLHGHQHYAGSGSIYVHADEHEVMAVISAASLCAGRRELPTGRLRGFNLVFVHPDRMEAEVWARAMDLQTVTSPEYAFNGGRGSRSLRWSTRRQTSGTVAVVLRAEAALRAGDVAQAATLLQGPGPALDDFGAGLLFDSLVTLHRFAEARLVLERNPAPDRAVRLVLALIGSREYSAAEEVLASVAAHLAPALADDLRSRLKLAKLAPGGIRGH